MTSPASDPDPDGPEWDEPRALDEEPAAAECDGHRPELRGESPPPDDPDVPVALELDDATPTATPQPDRFELTSDPNLDEPDRDDLFRSASIEPTPIPSDDQSRAPSSKARLVGGVVGITAAAAIVAVLWVAFGDRPKEQGGAVANADPGAGAVQNPPTPAITLTPEPTEIVPPASNPAGTPPETPPTRRVSEGTTNPPQPPMPPVEPVAAQPQPGGKVEENPPAKPNPVPPPMPGEVDPKDPPKPVPPVKTPKPTPAGGPIGPFAGGENPKPKPAATAPKVPALGTIARPSSSDLERDPP